MATCDRREFLSCVAVGVAASAVTAGEAASHPSTPLDPSGQAPRTAGGLAPPAFTPLPLGAIRPTGWLQRQLRIQADGLSGHLDEFWPDVGQSQ